MNETTRSIIAENWLRVCQQIEQACTEADRDPRSVQIVGVTKYVGPELAAQLVEAGCTSIGENRPQNLWQKHEWMTANRPDLAEKVEWHLIGHLQRNKIRRTLPLVSMIQSVDSLRLAQELNSEAVRIRRIVRILLDVNVSQDSTKTGYTVSQLLSDWERLAQLPNLQLCGLMAMSTQGAVLAAIRTEFAAVRQLRERLADQLGDRANFCELSMGMSGDFREAIAEGSTCVRIGSHLWTGVVR